MQTRPCADKDDMVFNDFLFSTAAAGAMAAMVYLCFGRTVEAEGPSAKFDVVFLAAIATFLGSMAARHADWMT